MQIIKNERKNIEIHRKLPMFYLEINLFEKAFLFEHITA